MSQHRTAFRTASPAVRRLAWPAASDIKIGQCVSPLQYETIDPAGSPFYTHSYIFNFGLPFKHAGVLSMTHLDQRVAPFLGIDTGVNTTIGPFGDVNNAVAGIAGFGLNLKEGRLIMKALTHFGPEDPSLVLGPAGFNASA
jgi:hypothetical protein